MGQSAIHTLRLWASCALACCCAAQGAWAQEPQDMPVAVQAALARAQVQSAQVALYVARVEGGAPLVAHRSAQPMNPASVTKLLTTSAALELLGPAYVWRTPLWTQGLVRDGVLHGNVYVQGRGDPWLLVERLWLMMRQLRAVGVQRISGDWVLDDSAFEAPQQDPGDFDGEGQRPYNAAASALLVNYKSITLSFTPDAHAGVAYVGMEPPLAGVQLAPTVPLSASQGCGDWRGALQARLHDARRIDFAGAFPGACGAVQWHLAYADANAYAARAFAGMWLAVGGSIDGQVRYGPVPAAVAQSVPTLQMLSPPLSEIVRSINKYSNNVMAQQVFLTLALEREGKAETPRARQAILRWWKTRVPGAPEPLIDNGSGLSRHTRASAAALGALLQAMWRSPFMGELLSSLPIAGVDGTLRRSRVRSAGMAHLKTGTLRDASALAGYVLGASGQRYVLVAMAQGNNAAAARPAFDALVDWTAAQ